MGRRQATHPGERQRDKKAEQKSQHSDGIEQLVVQAARALMYSPALYDTEQEGKQHALSSHPLDALLLRSAEG